MARPPIRFALNHIATPRLRPGPFFALARLLGLDAVEIRNDLAGNATLDGTDPEEIAERAAEAGVAIISINALQRFNDWSEARAAAARALADYAADAGARAVVLVPTNDGSGRADGERQRNLRIALSALAPILDERGLTGLVEPLGFESCSLRRKSEAVEAIEDTDTVEIFGLVHDTFHHHLAGQPVSFPALTGLVHISGVAPSAKPVAELRDDDRVLVIAADRIGNLRQIQQLRDAGYAGYFSFEPFAHKVQALEDPKLALRESMRLIADGVRSVIA